MAKAVALAVAEAGPGIRGRAAPVPLLGSLLGPLLGLGLEGDVAEEGKGGGVGVAFVSASGPRLQEDVVLIERAESLTVQQIADLVGGREGRGGAPDRGGPSLVQGLRDCLSRLRAALDPAAGAVPAGATCVIYTSPDSENNEVDISVAPGVPSDGPDGARPPPVAVLVGGVRVADRDPRTSSRSSTSRRPMLTLSIAIDSPACTIANCRKVAERVQTLVQFPEMCESGLP